MIDLFNCIYDNNKEENKMYIGKAKKRSDGSTYRPVSAFIESGDTYLSKPELDSSKKVDFSIDKSISLYETQKGQQKIFCWLIRSNGINSINALRIGRRTSKGNTFSNQEITLNAQAVGVLTEFLNEIKLCDDNTLSEIPLIHNNGKNRIISDDELSTIISNNIDRVEDLYYVIEHKRRGSVINELEEIICGKYENEISIQKFLKSNTWLFGNEYVHFAEGERINAGNILDGVPYNIESYIDILEVKLPEETLFYFDDSHKNYYPSSNLSKAIAQTQNYIFELEKKVNDEEYKTENNCKIVHPRALILFGSKEELNSKEKDYLRVLNSSFHNIQIVTYQQLLERAKNYLDQERRV